MGRIFKFVALSNWKQIEESSGEDSCATKRIAVWRDRSLAINFLFGLSRWKMTNKDLFTLILEFYHFSSEADVMSHLSRDLEKERKELRPIR